MKNGSAFCRQWSRILAATLLSLSCFVVAQASTNRHIGPGKVRITPKFGGSILGWDIDQNGSEVVLVEAGGSAPGTLVETFDQKTGKIIKVVAKTGPKDVDVTLGVVGASIGLIEDDHVGSNGFVDKRTYHILNPLASNKFTGLWKPPHFNANFIVEGVSRNQGTSTTAFLVLDNLGANAKNYVIGSDVANNTFGPLVKMTDVNLEPYLVPQIGLDTKTNTAVLSGDLGCPVTCIPDVALVDLTSGKVTIFQGVGSGSVNGLAVDSEDGIACTTTQDNSVEFYDLKTQTGFAQLLPGGQLGVDVEFDPIHKLFLVAQELSGTGPGSGIQVFDTKGNLVESLNGFSFSNRFTVIPMHIGINPNTRSGYVDDQVNQDDPLDLRSFTY